MKLFVEVDATVAPRLELLPVVLLVAKLLLDTSLEVLMLCTLPVGEEVIGPPAKLEGVTPMLLLSKRAIEF